MIELPGYTLLHKLGRGGMGEVYLAVQQSLGRQVALKLLTPELAEDDEARQRFVREARIAANLRHSHIVPIHDVGTHQGTAYISMEFEPGGTVGAFLHEALEPTKALRIARDVASALDYAHRQGVVHRDVKPENVLLRGDGQYLLSDFGISRAREHPTIVTQEGASVGTPQYMSPEQLRGLEIDGRSDLYSLGVMLYQMLTGKLPFEGKDTWALGMQHINAPIPYLPEHLGHLQGLVDALMAKEPDARPASGADVVGRIEALLAGRRPAPTRPMEPGAIAAQPAAVSRRPWWIAGAALVLVLVAALAVWGMRREAPKPAPAAVAPNAAAAQPSIAVLPFADLSQEHDQEYFSDGLSEELLDRLAKIPQLKVAGRTSSYAFKGKTGDLKAIGAQLGVAHVLEGSVRKAGDRIRISAKLVGVDDGFEHWTETYDRRLTDVFAVQDEIAVAVVRELRIKLLPDQRVTRTDRHLPTPEAYDQYLLGVNAMHINSVEAFAKAVAFFQRAVELDPLYDQAYSRLALAESFSAVGPHPGMTDPGVVRRHARAMVERALELNPDSPEAYSTRAYLRFLDDWDWSGAQADFDKAFALDPDYPTVLLKYSSLLGTLGKVPEAIAALRKESERDPMFPPPWDQLARYYVAQRDYPAAHAALARAVAVSPENPYPIRVRVVLELLEGDAKAALEDLGKLPSERLRLGGVALAQHALGNEREARAALDTLTTRYANDGAYSIAQVHARMGEIDEAFRWLDRAFEQRDTGLLALQYDPLLDPLRGDPRYQALRARMRFPD